MLPWFLSGWLAALLINVFVLVILPILFYFIFLLLCSFVILSKKRILKSKDTQKGIFMVGLSVNQFQQHFIALIKLSQCSLYIVKVFFCNNSIKITLGECHLLAIFLKVKYMCHRILLLVLHKGEII